MAKLRLFFGVANYYQSQMHLPCQELLTDWMLRMDLAENEAMERLKRIGENYRNIDELLRFLPLAQEADILRRGNRTTGPEVITLTTIHAAKGLEFPVVFVTGVEEGLLPFGDEPDQDILAEEQRLFYVAVTRAKQRLYLVNSLHRFQHGVTVSVEPSRFLKMFSPDLLEKTDWIQQSKKQKQLELF